MATFDPSRYAATRSKDRVIEAALGVLQSRIHNEHYPEDPYGDATAEHADEIFEKAVRDYSLLKSEMDDPRPKEG